MFKVLLLGYLALAVMLILFFLKLKSALIVNNLSFIILDQHILSFSFDNVWPRRLGEAEQGVKLMPGARDCRHSVGEHTAV